MKDGLKGKKIAVISDVVSACHNQKLLSSFNKLLGELKKKGATVEEVTFGEKALESIYATYIVISCAASRYGDYFTGGIGSVLKVDEFSLVYE